MFLDSKIFTTLKQLFEAHSSYAVILSITRQDWSLQLEYAYECFSLWCSTACTLRATSNALQRAHRSHTRCSPACTVTPGAPSVHTTACASQSHLVLSSMHTTVTPRALYHAQCEPHLNTSAVNQTDLLSDKLTVRPMFQMESVTNNFICLFLSCAWPLGCHVGGRYAQWRTWQRTALSFLMLNKSEYRQKTGC